MIRPSVDTCCFLIHHMIDSILYVYNQSYRSLFTIDRYISTIENNLFIKIKRSSLCFHFTRVFFVRFIYILLYTQSNSMTLMQNDLSFSKLFENLKIGHTLAKHTMLLNYPKLFQLSCFIFILLL